MPSAMNEKCSTNFDTMSSYAGVVRGQLHGQLHHVLAEEGHPGRAVRLFEVPAGRQRRAPVEHADVVEAEEAALEHVLAEAVLAVDPPGEVQHQLVERRREELEVHFAAQGLLGAVEEERGERVDRRVHVAEVPLVRGHLAGRVQVGAAQHQLHLALGEVGIGDRERERVEGQVPGRVPRVSHLSGIEMTSSLSMWNHSQFRVCRKPEWSGLEWCSSSQLSPSKKKNCLLQSMPAMAWRITLAASALSEGGVTAW